MSKRLPYFQFEPAEYLAGDIMFCSYGAQGVFNIIKSVYWQKDCCLTLEQAKRRCRGADDFINELIDENILKIENGNIIIHFLDEQYKNALETSKTNSDAGKKSAKLRKLRSEIKKSIDYIKQNSNEDLTEFQRSFNARSTDVDYLLQRKSTIKIIEDNIRENKEDNIIEDEVKDLETFYDIEILFNYYLKQDRIVNSVVSNKKHKLKDKEHLKERLREFTNNLQSKGRFKETFKEYASYFLNWVKIQNNVNKEEVDNPDNEKIIVFRSNVDGTRQKLPESKFLEMKENMKGGGYKFEILN